MTSQDDLHQEDRQALLKILSAVEAAINAQDIEGMIAQMHPDCTVTWWNAEISRGHADIRAYYPPEPYKGKGVRYAGEQIQKKEGKTVQ